MHAAGIIFLNETYKRCVALRICTNLAPMLPQYFAEVMNNVSDYLNQAGGLSGNFVQSLIVIVGLWIARAVFLRIAFRQVTTPAGHYSYRRYSAQAVFVIGLFLLGRIWVEGFQSLATFLGLLSVGLALALRDLLTNLAAWVFLMIRKPFTMGDRIEIMGVKGDVIDKRIFTFTVVEVGNRVKAEQSTGRVIHIPNGRIFTEHLANYTSDFDFVWDEVSVPITFESDHEKARELLLNIVNKAALDLVPEAEKELRHASEHMMLKYSILTPTVYTTVNGNGVVLSARFLTHVRKSRGLEQDIWLDVLREFKQHKDIQFAYTTVRVADLDKGTEPPAKGT